MQWWRPLPLRGSRAGRETRAAVGGPADQGEGSLAVFRIRTHQASWEFSDAGGEGKWGHCLGRSLQLGEGVSQIQVFGEEAGGDKEDARKEWWAGESTGQRDTSLV